jgi:hypothetical protein
MNEVIERRVFGAVEFVDDVTGARLLGPLQIDSPGVRLVRNHSGLHVIREIDGADAYTRAFANPPTKPARSDKAMTVRDPAGRYLPQAFTLALPRLLAAPGAPVADADNVLVPVQIRLMPAAALALQAAWAVLRLKLVVTGSNPELGLANVMVEATPAVAGLTLRRTLTDAHGEVLLVIEGAPPLLPDPGPAGLTRDFKVTLRLVLDKQVVRPEGSANLPVPNPGLIQQRRQAAHPDVSVLSLSDQLLSSGTSRRRVEKVRWP